MMNEKKSQTMTQGLRVKGKKGGAKRRKRFVIQCEKNTTGVKLLLLLLLPYQIAKYR